MTSGVCKMKREFQSKSMYLLLQLVNSPVEEELVVHEGVV